PSPPSPIATLSPYTTLFRSDWRGAGKPAHREHGIGHPRSEKPSGSAVRSVKAAKEVDYTASFQTDGRQGDDRNTLQILDRLLIRSEDHTSELQSRVDLVCRL